MSKWGGAEGAPPVELEGEIVMDTLMVAVFDTESGAYEGVKALQDLSWSGDITVYATAVIGKDLSGEVEMKQEPEGGSATVFGLVAGGLIGLLAGPVGAAAGATAAAASSAALVGSYAGAVVGAGGGAVVDLTRYGFSLDFIDEVSTYLIPGTYAVLAEVDETWMAPVDTRLGLLGGVVFRRPASEAVEDQLAREATRDRRRDERARRRDRRRPTRKPKRRCSGRWSAPSSAPRRCRPR